MRSLLTVLTLSILGSSTIFAEEATTISVKIGSAYDGNEIWAGIVIHDEQSVGPQWTSFVESEFLIEVPETESTLSIVLLKKNVVPIVKQITKAHIANGIVAEFSDGATIVGRVVTKTEDTPITEGSMSITLEESEYKFLAPLSDLFEWEIDEDGTFAIHGIPKGEHEVSVTAPGFMPSSSTVLITADDQETEIEFTLPTAEFVNGHMELYRDYVQVIGEIDVVVAPLESQTVEFTVEFDEEKNFRIGPFAEDAEIELSASLPTGQRSWPRKVPLPSDREITLWLYDWVRITGNVQDKETGEPIQEFTLVANSLNPVYEIKDSHGQFSEEVDEHLRSLSIDASGYIFWDSGTRASLRGLEEFDFGTIELERSNSVEGTVLDGITQQPIAGAEVFKLTTEDENMYIVRWNVVNVKTTSDGDGKFELDGFGSDGGKIYASADGYSAEALSFEDLNEPLEFNLYPLGSISGQVVSLDGEPVPAWIHFPGGATRTDDGNFHFNVGAGTHRYRASADSGRSGVVEIPVEVGEVVEGVRIVIDSIGRVFGTVEGLVSGETTQVWAIGSGVSSDVLAADGPYEFFGLEPGDYVVRSKTSFNREIEVPITMDESNEVRVDLQFPSGGSLSGTVLASGQPLSNVTVIAQPADENLPLGRMTTDSEGVFEFKALAQGTYQVQVPGRAFDREIEIDGPMSVELSVGDHTISGQLRAGGSLLNIAVRIKGGPEHQLLERGLVDVVDASGNFRFVGLPTGSYTLEVTHSDYSEHSQELEVSHDIVDVEIYLEEAVTE